VGSKYTWHIGLLAQRPLRAESAYGFLYVKYIAAHKKRTEVRIVNDHNFSSVGAHGSDEFIEWIDTAFGMSSAFHRYGRHFRRPSQNGGRITVACDDGERLLRIELVRRRMAPWRPDRMSL
jgi:hypothetical protein